MHNCQLNLQVSALNNRTVLDKHGNKRYVSTGNTGYITGWGRGSIDVIWKIPKPFGGYYEVLEVHVRETDLIVSSRQLKVNQA